MAFWKMRVCDYQGGVSPHNNSPGTVASRNGLHQRHGLLAAFSFVGTRQQVLLGTLGSRRHSGAFLLFPGLFVSPLLRIDQEENVNLKPLDVLSGLKLLSLGANSSWPIGFVTIELPDLSRLTNTRPKKWA
jgi:hypothetical protein